MFGKESRDAVKHVSTSFSSSVGSGVSIKNGIGQSPLGLFFAGMNEGDAFEGRQSATRTTGKETNKREKILR